MIRFVWGKVIYIPGEEHFRATSPENLLNVQKAVQRDCCWGRKREARTGETGQERADSADLAGSCKTLSFSELGNHRSFKQKSEKPPEVWVVFRALKHRRTANLNDRGSSCSALWLARAGLKNGFLVLPKSVLSSTRSPCGTCATNQEQSWDHGSKESGSNDS